MLTNSVGDVCLNQPVIGSSRGVGCTLQRRKYDPVRSELAHVSRRHIGRHTGRYLLNRRPRTQLGAHHLSGATKVKLGPRKVCVCLAGALIAARDIPIQEYLRSRRQWREQRSEVFLFFPRLYYMRNRFLVGTLRRSLPRLSSGIGPHNLFPSVKESPHFLQLPGPSLTAVPYRPLTCHRNCLARSAR